MEGDGAGGGYIMELVGLMVFRGSGRGPVVADGKCIKRTPILDHLTQL
jgi:hypothetical protein